MRLTGRRHEPPEPDPAFVVAQAIMTLTDAIVTPMHEWLEGERQYFESLGYTPDEARAMSAVTYVNLFGTQINRTGSPSEETEDPPRPDEP